MNLEFDGAILRIQRTSAPPGLVVEGEVDATTVNELSKALSEAIQDREGDVNVDLGGVTFIDLAGLRVLADAASVLPVGRSLVLAPVAAHVEHLIRLIGWDDTPGLRLAGRGAR